MDRQCGWPGSPFARCNLGAAFEPAAFEPAAFEPAAYVPAAYVPPARSVHRAELRDAASARGEKRREKVNRLPGGGR
jgi:hypothetical protein